MSTRNVFTRASLLLMAVAFFLIHSISAPATSVSLAWNPSASPSATGYRVYYGAVSGVYTTNVDAGDNTNLTISNLTPGGTYYLAVLAYDAYGDVSPFSSEIEVNLQSAPVITKQPVNETVGAGALVDIAVNATSTGPLGYQWFHGAAALVGATNYITYLAGVSTADSGQYSVVVFNNFGSVTSNPVILKVRPPFQTLSPSLIQGQGLQLQFTGTQGSNYILQAATSLVAPVKWQPIATNYAGAYGYWSFTDTNALVMPARFYRTMLQ